MRAPLIDAAVNFYTVLTRKIPFDQLCVTSDEIPTVARQATYDLDALLDPTLNAISSIRLTYGPQGSNSVRLRRSAVRLYDSISINVPSRPSTYARWGNSIELNTVPDSSSYTMRFRYYKKVTIAETPEDTVCEIPDEWAELIKWELLYRAYYYIKDPNSAMALVTPSMLPRGPSPRRQVMYEIGIIPRLWNDLLSTTSAKEAPDEDFSINPVVRNYSTS